MTATLPTIAARYACAPADAYQAQVQRDVAWLVARVEALEIAEVLMAPSMGLASDIEEASEVWRLRSAEAVKIAQAMATADESKAGLAGLLEDAEEGR